MADVLKDVLMNSVGALEAGGNSGVNVTVSLSGKGPDGLSHDHEFTVSLIGPDEEWRVPKVGRCRLTLSKPVLKAPTVSALERTI
jgi:hypothetical protein